MCMFRIRLRVYLVNFMRIEIFSKKMSSLHQDARETLQLILTLEERLERLADKHDFFLKMTQTHK